MTKPAPMADDALTRKDAEMGRMTREQVEELRALLHDAIYEDSVKWNSGFKSEVLHGLQELCSLALRALSLESVREEALDQGDKLMQAKRSGYDEGRWMGLEEAAKVCDNLVGGRSHSGDAIAERLATAIRALQHAPARVAEGEPVHTDHPSRHWDRTCPACLAEGPPDMPAPESPAKEQPK